jgi:DNA repair protein RadA/Sms
VADVYASAVGGVRVTEPGADLAIAIAVASALFERPIHHATVALGEIGLGGEIRQVPQLARRVAEAARLGFTHAVGPPGLPEVPGVEITSVDTLTAALRSVFGDQTPAERGHVRSQAA